MNNGTGEVRDAKTDIIAIACIGAFPLMATFLEKGVVVLLAVLGLAGLIAAVRAGQAARLMSRGAWILAAVTLVWIGYCSIDTFNGQPTTAKLLSLAVLVLLGAGAVWLSRGMPEGARARVLKVLTISGAVSMALIAVAWLIVATGNRQLIGTNRSDILSLFSAGMVIIAIVSPAVIAHLLAGGRTWQACGFAVAMAVVAALSSSNAAVLGIAAMAVAAGLVWKFPRIMPRAIAVACVAGTLLLPGAITLTIRAIDDGYRPLVDETHATDPDGLAGSFGHRYYIWRFATERAAERPVTGWGFDSSRAIPGGHETIAIGKELMPLHPHNATLQIWLELGIPGLVLAAGVLWLLFRHRLDASGGVADAYVKPLMLLCVCVTWNATFGLWQSWWLSALALALAVMFLFERRPGERTDA